MNSRSSTVLAMAALCAGLATSVTANTPNADSQIISFDAPAAGTAPGQGTGCFGCTFAINQWGAIVGTYLDANNVYHGFIRSAQGKYSTIDAPLSCADTTPQDYNGTFAQGINDVGEVTGMCADQSGDLHGFVRTPQGVFTVFDALQPALETWPLSINDEGAVVGFVFDGDSSLFRAFLRDPGGALVVFVGPDSCPLGFNETPACYGNEASTVTLLGASVGNFEDSNLVGHGMIRSASGEFMTFDVPGAGTGLYQGTGCPGCNMGVNHFGMIAGSYTDKNNLWHGFLRNADGKFVTFEATGAGTSAYQGTGCYSDCPMSVNDLGEIAGSYSDSNYVQHGFVRTPEGSFVTIDPPGSVGTQPESINDLGAITGYYVDANGVYHAFIRHGY
jgi:hypothetical protein